MKSYILALTIGVLIAASLFGGNSARAMESSFGPSGECRLEVYPSGVAFCRDIDNCSDGCTLTVTYGQTARTFSCNLCSDSTPNCSGVFFIPHNPLLAAYLQCTGIGCGSCDKTTDPDTGNDYCDC